MSSLPERGELGAESSPLLGDGFRFAGHVDHSPLLCRREQNNEEWLLCGGCEHIVTHTRAHTVP